MSKKIKLAPRACSAAVQPTKWDICALCQEHGGTLINHSPKGYLSLTTHLSALHALNKVPLNINIYRLDNGDGMEKTFVAHKAMWHKACYVRCNATKVERARIQHDQASHEQADSPVKHHLRSAVPSVNPMETEQPVCFFCDEPTGELHKATTMDIDTRVRQKTTDMRDTRLLSKLSTGAMVAIDTVYHTNCLSTFHNRYRSHTRRSYDNPCQINPQALALAEVVSYIEEYGQLDGNVNHVFKLADIAALYSECLEKLGGDTSGRVHSTRLAQKLQHHIPALDVHQSKSGTVLSFKENVGDAIPSACHIDPDEEATMLIRAANLIRKDIFDKKYHFDGSLCDEQYDHLPTYLSALVGMILGGSNARQNMDDHEVSTAASSITQLLVYNAVKRGRKDSKTVRHNPDRETALPLYIGLLIHNRTRKRDLIDLLFQKGLSVSYDRVLQVSTDEANRVIDMFEKEGTVCPTSLKDDLFTTGNFDNIDHNPSSTSSHDSFHGTALSVTQHITHDNPGVDRVLPEVPESERQPKSKSIKPLPKSYTDVPPTVLPEKVTPTTTDDQVIPTSTHLDADEKEKLWLQHVAAAFSNETQDDQADMNISWSAYFAGLQVSVPKPPAIVALLPMFRDTAHSPAMVKHGMDIIARITAHVNPGQIPVFTVDQPLYAIAKKIQWTWPDQYGETQHVVMMGGLHIEMAMLSVIGDWLGGSGWTYVMASANVTTEGRALGLQKGSHTSRAQWAHQVTAAALFRLLNISYAEYCTITPDNEQLDFEDWCKHMASAHPQFDYWYVLQLEILFMHFLRSREQQFVRYVESLGKMIPWMFALDHYHYARWMTVHVRDLLLLEKTSPTTHAEFVSGNFVTQKSRNKFSSLAHDQVHEQLNAMVKGDGGAIGLTENEAALTRWMVAGPETARILHEYDEKHFKAKDNTGRHHEQIPSVQKQFVAHVKGVTDVIEEIGNPFSDSSTDLYTLDTKVIMPESVVHTVRTAEDLGKAQYQKFVQERINGNITAFSNTIQKNNLPLFNSSSRKAPAKCTSKIVSLQNDVRLFSRMYISCQSRDSDMDAFFSHENHAWPPSLASNNTMHQTTKSDLMGCLESLVPQPDVAPM